MMEKWKAELLGKASGYLLNPEDGQFVKDTGLKLPWWEDQILPDEYLPIPSPDFIAARWQW